MPLYHSALYDWEHNVDSLWESERGQFPAPLASPLAADETAEVAIIGGGYCGLSAAYHLARQGIEVRVLEAGAIGWGASGRNGGFCSVGASFLGVKELASIYGEAATLAFYRVLIDAVRLVEELSLEEGFDLQAQGTGIWTFAHKPSRLPELEAHAALLQRLGVGARMISPQDFESQAFRCTEQFGALFEPVGFGLHPLAFCLGLANAVVKRSGRLHSFSRVTSWIRERGRHRLRSANGSVLAKRVIVAANGWLPEALVPELSGRVLPIMSNITTTPPLLPEVLNAQAWHTRLPAANTRAHLAYLRLLPDNRLLFGGRGDTTGRPAGLARMRRLLERRRAKMFPAMAHSNTTHSWRGLICATRRLTPAVGTLPSDPTVGFAFGCHGNGVAFMTWAGKALAETLSGRRCELPVPVQGLPPRFPLPSLRLWALRLMLLRAAAEDELC
ncbi:MAG: FAD-binding oxidoreductase [Micropepsaceae bacterium]